MSDKKSVLIVVSKAKAYCKSQEASLSAEAIDVLTTKVQQEMDKAIARAKAEGRKVVKDRDFKDGAEG